MISIQDPYGLIYSMYPRYWDQDKRLNVGAMSRLDQIREVIRYRKYEERGVYEVFSEERIKEMLEKEGKFGVEKVGDHWYRVHCGKDGFYTNEEGAKEFDRLLKERMGRG
jgi:hypothetical protein